jgi:hypothetical protein
MTKLLSKELYDKIVEQFLVEISNQDDKNQKLAVESQELLNDEGDSATLATTLINHSLDKLDRFTEDVKMLEATVLSAMFTCFKEVDERLIPKGLRATFSGTDEEIRNNMYANKPLQYAIRKFSVAYLEYQNFQKKYPEINKHL